jgi:hypothetical protein
VTLVHDGATLVFTTTRPLPTPIFLGAVFPVWGRGPMGLAVAWPGRVTSIERDGDLLRLGITAIAA